MTRPYLTIAIFLVDVSVDYLILSFYQFHPYKGNSIFNDQHCVNFTIKLLFVIEIS